MRKKIEQFDIDGLRQLIERDPGCPEFPALAEAERRAGRPDTALQVSAAGLEHAPERLAGRVSLGLALLDLGRNADARDELACILDAVLEPHHLAEALPQIESPQEGPTDDSGFHRADAEDLAALPIQTPDRISAFDAGIAVDEIDQAFESAETDPQEMFSANRMAEEALLRHAPIADEENEVFDVEPDSSFHTRTMASLLERQGDVSGARAIRDSLEAAQNGAAESTSETDAAVAELADADSSPVVRELRSGAQRSRRERILATLDTWLHNIQRGVI